MQDLRCFKKSLLSINKWIVTLNPNASLNMAGCGLSSYRSYCKECFLGFFKPQN